MEISPWLLRNREGNKARWTGKWNRQSYNLI